MRNQEIVSHNGHKNGLIYLVAGGAIGAGLALLFAPKSGKEFREDISTTTLKGFDQAKEITANLSEKAKNVYGQAQTKAVDTYETAKEGINSTIQNAKERFATEAEKAKELPEKAETAVKKGLDKVADKAENIAQEVKHH